MFNKKIEKFIDLGLGLFVHYGVYSVLGQGEWVMSEKHMSIQQYEKVAKKFKPKEDWSDDLCRFAKDNGFRYIVLTTRHHDGFSLYDTKVLSDFDAQRFLHRDLVKEFVASCKKFGIKPFFYHTLIDWREEQNFKCFSDYLGYLRNSLKILCTEYGEIGGFWFDGQWKYPDEDWEEEKMFDIIKTLQPNAMIINNSGLNNLGAKIGRFADVVTFERNDISNYDYKKDSKFYAAEMCQTLNSHWGYAENDINYKSIKEILLDFCKCRKFGGNFLLNVGPKQDGSIRDIDKALISLFGKWVNLNKTALYQTRPIDISLPQNCFALKGKHNEIFLFVTNLPMALDMNISEYRKNPIRILFDDCKKIKSASWIDNKEKIMIRQIDCKEGFDIEPFMYGENFIVRVAKIVF